MDANCSEVYVWAEHLSRQCFVQNSCRVLSYSHNKLFICGWASSTAFFSFNSFCVFCLLFMQFQIASPLFEICVSGQAAQVQGECSRSLGWWDDGCLLFCAWHCKILIHKQIFPANEQSSKVSMEKCHCFSKVLKKADCTIPGLVTFSHNSHCRSAEIDIALDRPKKKIVLMYSWIVSWKA